MNKRLELRMRHGGRSLHFGKGGKQMWLCQIEMDRIGSVAYEWNSKTRRTSEFHSRFKRSHIETKSKQPLSRVLTWPMQLTISNPYKQKK